MSEDTKKNISELLESDAEKRRKADRRDLLAILYSFLTGTGDVRPLKITYAEAGLLNQVISLLSIDCRVIARHEKFYLVK